jgi:NAD+ kinase
MQNIGLYVNTTKPDAIEWTERAARLLKSAGIECCAEPSVVAQFSKQTAQFVKAVEIDDFEKFADIIVSFGGDGTILNAAKAFIDSEIPIMGVNLGNLGFLAEYSTDELENAFSALIKGEYIVEERCIIEAIVQTQDFQAHSAAARKASASTDAATPTRFYAVNDFVIHKKDFARMITIRAYVDGHPIADYRSDGLILATPTGSTAYSLSSGGPIIAPNSAVFALTPISPHSLNQRPLIVPESSEVWFEPTAESGQTSLVADGEVVAVLEPRARVIIHRSEKVVKLLKRLQSSYYELLKKKLLWSVHSGQ